MEGLPLFMVSHQLVLFRSPRPRRRAETHSGVQARAFPTTLQGSPSDLHSWGTHGLFIHRCLFVEIPCSYAASVHCQYKKE